MMNRDKLSTFVTDKRQEVIGLTLINQKLKGLIDDKQHLNK